MSGNNNAEFYPICGVLFLSQEGHRGALEEEPPKKLLFKELHSSIRVDKR